MLLATKPMQLATYFCTYIAPDPLDWRHYALAVGHYTHFTSPIRWAMQLTLVSFFDLCG
jgi:DIS3-like exonuclease 2